MWRITRFILTSIGDVHDHVGEWVEDEETLRLWWNGIRFGKPTEEELTLVLVSDNEIQGHETDKVDGVVA